jgi:hypothetical protein
MDSAPEEDGAIERESRFRAVPFHELVNGMSVAALYVG